MHTHCAAQVRRMWKRFRALSAAAQQRFLETCTNTKQGGGQGADALSNALLCLCEVLHPASWVV